MTAGKYAKKGIDAVDSANDTRKAVDNAGDVATPPEAQGGGARRSEEARGRPVPFPGKGHRMTATSYEDHAEGDMATQALAKGLKGGNAKMYTARDTCNFCRNSIAGYAEQLGLDSLEVYGPSGLLGRYTKQAGKVEWFCPPGDRGPRTPVPDR